MYVHGLGGQGACVTAMGAATWLQAACTRAHHWHQCCRGMLQCALTWPTRCAADIPLQKAVAGARVGLLDGQFVVNPTAAQMAASRLDLVMAGTADAVLMIEGYCDFLSEAEMLEVRRLALARLRRCARSCRVKGLAAGL